jgi:CubicO group peptidase (beta-lactamase class C family)
MQVRYVASTLLLAVALSQFVIAQNRLTKDWPTSTPQAVGLDPKVLAAFDADIAAGKYGNVDSMLVIRHGKLVYDRSYKHDYDKYFAPIYATELKKPGAFIFHDPSGPYNYINSWCHPFYHHTDLHTMQSVTKTVTSVAIGLAVTRQEFPDLDTPILKFFDAKKVANLDERKQRITIRHLLTMTAGLDWREDVPYANPENTADLMEASWDWVQFTIDRPMSEEPGKRFNYNSGATQLLSYIFRVATGKDIEEYAAQNLFAPLGIEHYFWKRSPSGLADTEGGLYLRPHDLAKIAYLFLKDGVWNGKRIVSADWVKRSITPSIDTGRPGVKYGYKWWLYPYDKDGAKLAWAGSGYGGQRPIILPEYDIVMVFTGWNIAPDAPALPPQVAIERVLSSVVDRPVRHKTRSLRDPLKGW